MGEIKYVNLRQFWLGSIKLGDHFKDLVIDGVIILKWALGNREVAYGDP